MTFVNTVLLRKILASRGFTLSKRLIRDRTRDLADDYLVSVYRLRRGTTKLSRDSPMFKETFAEARSNLDKLLNGKLVKRSLSPSLTTTLSMADRHGANDLSLDKESPYQLRDGGTMLTLTRRITTNDLTNRTTTLGTTMLGALERWRCLLPPSFF